jgi:hypothetical protein
MGTTFMKKLILATLSLALAGCATHNQIRVSTTDDIEIKNLAVIVPESGTFEVQNARLRQDGTSTALFGLIGYAIEAGHRDSLDTEKEQQVREYVEQLDCAGDLASAIQTTFRDESEINSTLYRSENELAGTHDAQVIFKVQQCGFTLTNRDSELFVPFITLNAKAMSSDGYVIWDDKETFTGKEEVSFQTMLAGEGVAAKLLDDLLNEAGARLAYQIVYQ